MIFLLLGLLLLGAAAAIAVRAVTGPRLEASDRLAQIEAYGFADAKGETARVESFKTGLEGLADRIGRVTASRLRGFSEAKVRNQLMGAGLYGMTPSTFLGYRVMGAAALSIALLWVTAASGSPPAILVLATLFGALTGWVVPQTLVRTRAERRMAQIELDLPELIDLLVLMVEAGLGFSGSIRIASSRLDGPLGDELRLTLQEQSMGLSTNESLTNLLGRCETPSMRSFVRSVLQGENLGVSIGAIMRNLAAEMRKRRRHSAEERAQKAPIKMLFPLVFLIFPTLFIILLYPAIHSLGQSFGTG